METISKEQTIESVSNEVTMLKEELNKCIGTGLQKNERLRSRIYTAITALFLPVETYNRKTSDWQSEAQPWWYFRNFLFELDLFSNEWVKKDFRDGVDMLNDICQATDSYPKKLKQFNKYEMAHRLFGCTHEAENIAQVRAIEALIAALKMLIENADHPDLKMYLDIDDLLDMVATMQAIRFYQLLWINASDVTVE